MSIQILLTLLKIEKEYTIMDESFEGEGEGEDHVDKTELVVEYRHNMSKYGLDDVHIDEYLARMQDNIWFGHDNPQSEVVRILMNRFFDCRFHITDFARMNAHYDIGTYYDPNTYKITDK